MSTPTFQALRITTIQNVPVPAPAQPKGDGMHGIDVGPQAQTLEALRSLLDTTGAHYRLLFGELNGSDAIYELVIDDKPWGWVAFTYYGSLYLKTF